MAEGLPQDPAQPREYSLSAVGIPNVWQRELRSSELRDIIHALAESLKPGGVLVFREPLRERGKIGVIKHLIEQNSLFLKESRITDIPLLGNALESVYIK